MSTFDALDGIAVITYLLLIIGLPLIGYWLMIVDIRAYLRALKGALVIVKNHIPGLPSWAKQYTPASLRSMGLEMPCSEQEVKRAYRVLAERLHPDRGGDRQKFLELQRHFEEAMEFVREVNVNEGLPKNGMKS